MEGLNGAINYPVVWEQSQVVARVAGNASNALVIQDIPTIHAKRIDILINSIQGCSAVRVRVHGCYRRLTVVSATLGTVAAGTNTGFTYGETADEAIGDSLDVEVDNATANLDTVTITVIART
jgi:hypothetical protein